MSLDETIKYCEENKITYADYQKQYYENKEREKSVKNIIDRYKRNCVVYGRLGYKITYKGV